MRFRFALLVWLVPVSAHAAAADGDVTYSLRAAEAPAASARQWDQGASLSYVAKDGKATWHSDVVAKIGYSWLVSDKIDPAKLPDGGVTRWTIEAGPYWHRLDGADVPINDRGGSLRLSMYRVPAGAATGAVVSFKGDLVASGGTTLKDSGGDLKGKYVNVDSKRLLGSGSLYYQRASNWFLRLTAGAYSDDVSGSPTTLNGRESGLQAGVQWSFYPLELMGKRIGPYELVPLVTLKAQKQFDRSATENRTKKNYELYTALLSLPLAFSNSATMGLVPSLDISRSFGADLLTGRARSGITQVSLALKY